MHVHSPVSISFVIAAALVPISANADKMLIVCPAGSYRIDDGKRTVTFEKEPATKAGRKTPFYKTVSYKVLAGGSIEWNDSEDLADIRYVFDLDTLQLAAYYRYRHKKFEDKSFYYHCIWR